MKKNIFMKKFFIGILVLFVVINLSPLSVSLIKEDMFSTDYSEKKYLGIAEDETSISITSYVDSKTSDKIIKSNWFCVPSIIKKGDIAFCDHNRPLLPGYRNDNNFANDHVLIYLGNNRFIESTAIFPCFYKGSEGWDLCKLGVRKSSFCLLNFWATNITFGTVRNVSESQRDNAVEWAKTQIRHPYQFASIPTWPYHMHSWWCCPNPNGTTYNPDTGEYFIEVYPDYWICAELLWAAYNHCNGDSGIDICAKWEYDKNDDSWHWITMPDYWLNDYEQIYLYTDGYYGNPGTGKPLVESFDVNVSLDSVTIYGKLLDDGNERCHCYIYLIGEGNRYCGFFNNNSIETFSKIIKHLTPGTTYQWYAWAYNSFGEVYGETKSFTTLPSK